MITALTAIHPKVGKLCVIIPTLILVIIASRPLYSEDFNRDDTATGGKSIVLCYVEISGRVLSSPRRAKDHQAQKVLIVIHSAASEATYQAGEGVLTEFSSPVSTVHYTHDQMTGLDFSDTQVEILKLPRAVAPNNSRLLFFSDLPPGDFRITEIRFAAGAKVVTIKPHDDENLHVRISNTGVYFIGSFRFKWDSWEEKVLDGVGPAIISHEYPDEEPRIPGTRLEKPGEAELISGILKRMKETPYEAMLRQRLEELQVAVPAR